MKQFTYKKVADHFKESEDHNIKNTRNNNYEHITN